MFHATKDSFWLILSHVGTGALDNLWKYKRFQEMQCNINQLEEFKDMFTFTLSGYVWLLNNEMSMMLSTMQEVEETFLKALICWG